MSEGVIATLVMVAALVGFGAMAFHEANAEREHLRDCDKRHGVYLVRDAVCVDSILVRY